MTERFVVVPAAYVVFLREREGRPEVLLQLREGTGYMDGHWANAAAGHVERGEMHRTGAPGPPIDERVDYFFSTRSWTGEPRIVEPDKCADLRWFRLDALPEPVVQHELRVLSLLRTGEVPPILAHGF